MTSFTNPHTRTPPSPEISARVTDNHPPLDPDLYDTLVRQFQTPAEREAEIRSRGWGKVLESSLMRGEDRLDRVASSLAGDRPQPASSSLLSSSASRRALPPGSDRDAAATTTDLFTLDADLADSKPATKEEGRAAWEDFLRARFVRGGDEDFDYARVDGDERYDELESRDREEEWFDGEEPEWASDGSDDGGSGEEDAVVGGGLDGGLEEGGRRRRRSRRSRKGPRERVLVGQTGVQDY